MTDDVAIREHEADVSEPLEQHGDELIASIRAGVRPRLYVISGPSGVGKDTVIDRLRPLLPEYYFAVTATTRERRPGEIDGVHYFFMTVDEFHEHLEQDELIEHAEVYGNWYGVPKAGIRNALRDGRDAIVKVDVQGAATIRKLAPEAVLIFLMPPSMADLIRRLWERKTDAKPVMMRRVHTAIRELEDVRDFDYVVFNEDGQIDKTLAEIMAIITSEQLRVNQSECVL